MMTSSSDELLTTGRRAGRRHRPSAGYPRQAARDPRLLGPDRPRHHHRSARAVGLRQDHADAQHRRNPDRRRGHASRCSGQPAGSAELRHRVGYVPQDPTIYDDLRIIDNVRYFAALYGMDASAADARRLTRSASTDHRTALCGNLSGGQRTRVSLACALVCHPDLLVLDEPTVGLDPVLRVDLWEQFHATRPARNHTAGLEPRDGRGRPLRRPAADARRPPARPHHPDATTRGHRMSVTGGSVSVRHPAQHRSRSRLSPTGLYSPPPRGSCASSPPITAASR